jgi:hypothetical protein
MAFNLDLKYQQCERCLSRSAQPNPRRGPGLPRPMHDSHCEYSAWGEGWGEGHSNSHEESPLTPTLSPRGLPARELWRGEREGSLSRSHSVRPIESIQRPAAFDQKCQMCERRVSRNVQPDPQRGPALPRPMHDSHCEYSAWGEGWGEGPFVHCPLFAAQCSLLVMQCEQS